MRDPRPGGMTGFTVVWAGQRVSLLGTAMSNFALTPWAYEVTGKATPLALVGFFFATPMVVLGPFVGTWLGGRRGYRCREWSVSGACADAAQLVERGEPDREPRPGGSVQ